MRTWHGVRIGVVAAIAGLVLAPLPAGAQGRDRPAPGSVGVGDPVFPSYGNGGYQVRHYDVAVTYQPANGRLTGVTTIRATSTQALSRFDLDLVLHASAVTVDGRPAGFRQYRIATDTEHGGKLEITPARPIRRGAPMTVLVRYSDLPAQRTLSGMNPWQPTPGGAIVEGAPESAAWWFPSNDALGDKADYDVRLTAPSDLVALSGGTLVASHSAGGWTTRHWRQAVPIATYQQFAAFGRYRIGRGRSATGIPLTYALSADAGPGGPAAIRDILGTGPVLDWLSRTYGPYPMPSGGGVLTDDPYAGLETAAHPVYGDYYWTDGFTKPYPDWNVVVHENAHQWFGDSVTPANWAYFWLPEGFATFTEWLYGEQHGATTAADAFAQVWARYPADSAYWQAHVGRLRDYAEWAGASAYTRGAMTLQALRVRLGDATFFRVLRAWVTRYRHGTVTTAQFTRLATRLSGQDLTSFFRAWLETPTRPAATAANGFPPALRTG